MAAVTWVSGTKMKLQNLSFMFLVATVTWVHVKNWNPKPSTIQVLSNMHHKLKHWVTHTKTRKTVLVNACPRSWSSVEWLQEIFLFFKSSTQPPIQWVPATRCNAKVKNEWSCTSAYLMSLCAFMAWTGWTLLFYFIVYAHKQLILKVQSWSSFDHSPLDFYL
jgi:hypothetical protein